MIMAALVRSAACVAAQTKTAVSRSSAAAAAGRRAAAARRCVCRAADDAALVDYDPKTVFLFPGQGAQYVGMAKELVETTPAAKDMFDAASSVLGYDLLKVCVDGPDTELNTTAVSQPAIYVASLAALEKLKMEDPSIVESCNVAAGLSLGEYTALTFAGALTFEDGIKLVKVRGESMQAAADAKPSGMASVIGLDSAKVQELCDAVNAEVGADQSVKIANYLCNGNYAVSGGLEGIEAVQAKGKPDFKARMVVRLAVAGAFHTDYMSPAAERLGEALADTTISVPRIPVVSNVDVVPHSDPDTIRSILSQQLVSPVKWEDTMKTLLEKGADCAYEIGPGKVCAGIMKRVDKKFSVTNIEA